MTARVLAILRSFVFVLAVSALPALPLMGCANHIFKPFNVDRGDSLSIDAKQRVVLVTHKGGKTGDRTIVCAEPSPDALSAQAAAGSTNGSVTLPAPGAVPAASGSASAAASGSSSESVASIANRSQTIQLLRDGLYRACEAYLNGAIDQHQYNVVLLNMDKLMISAMGLDAIAGTQAALAPGTAGAATAHAVQSEAAANVVLAATAPSSLPRDCLALLASGELRLDNPGQKAVLDRCDILLAGAMADAADHPRHAPTAYKMTVPPPVQTSSALPQETPSSKPVAMASHESSAHESSARAATAEPNEAGWYPSIERLVSDN